MIWAAAVRVFLSRPVPAGSGRFLSLFGQSQVKGGSPVIFTGTVVADNVLSVQYCVLCLYYVLYFLTTAAGYGQGQSGCGPVRAGTVGLQTGTARLTYWHTAGCGQKPLQKIGRLRLRVPFLSQMSCTAAHQHRILGKHAFKLYMYFWYIFGVCKK